MLRCNSFARPKVFGVVRLCIQTLTPSQPPPMDPAKCSGAGLHHWGRGKSILGPI